jgi:hypothetical protein
MPTVRQIIKDAAAQNYKVSAFVQGVVASQAFQKSQMAPSATMTTMER